MGLFKALVDRLKVKPSRNAEDSKKIFYGALLKAVQDGELTLSEMSDLDELRAELRLTDEDVKVMRVKAFQVAVNAATADGLITPKEEKDLQTIKSYLGLAEGEVARNRGTLNKMRVLFEIQKGNLPIETIPGLGLKLGEMAHVSKSAILLEATGPVAPAGVVLKRGAPYRMGAGRPTLMPESGLVSVATGSMTVTNQRLMFNAGQKSFGLRYEKILTIAVYADGYAIQADTGGLRFLRLELRQDLEMIAAILSRFLNQS